jgi:hypothetical protein
MDTYGLGSMNDYQAKAYKTMHEAIDSIGYGMCSICKAKHEFPNIKCDLMHQEEEGK